MTCSVRMLLPAAAASTNVSCAAPVASLVYEAVFDAAALATPAANGVNRCAPAGALARMLQSGGAGCSGAQQAVIYYVPIVIAPGGSAASALSAVNALTAASFASAANALAASTGCSAAAFAYAGITTTAACGTGATAAQPQCDLAAFQATPTPDNIFPPLFGSLVAAAFIIFVAAVLALRGNCACCGTGCPQASTKPLDALY